MKYSRRLLQGLLFVVLVNISLPGYTKQSIRWKKLDNGLAYGQLLVKQDKSARQAVITIIKINPKLYEFTLLAASETKDEIMSAQDWAKKYGLTGAINAGMFLPDYLTNVGYMRNDKHLNNPRYNSKYQSLLVFNPIGAAGKTFDIVDVSKKNFDTVSQSYQTVVQNLRLIKHRAHNVWKKSDKNKKWSEAALGIDKYGNALFIFSKTPFTMYEFNQLLINSDLKISAAQHLEGGPEASLYLKHNQFELILNGSYETGFNENENNTYQWPIPNVIGFKKRLNSSEK